MDRAARLSSLIGIIQVDVGGRGLARDPADNLFTACPDDLLHAARSLARTPNARLGVVTGFWIPTVERAETDGPLGAVYLARTLPDLGVGVVLISDPFVRPSLEAGLRHCERTTTPIIDLPESGLAPLPPLTHLLALERVGPTHTPTTIRGVAGEDTVTRFLTEVSPERHGRCHTMRGRDITTHMRDAAALFEQRPANLTTIGIGDGGNEIGMGKIPWQTIARNITGGADIACRVATDHLIVCGISNWGAYALATATAIEARYAPGADWYDVSLEQQILQTMVEQGRLVDGVSGQATATVDGISFADYAQVLMQLEAVMVG